MLKKITILFSILALSGCASYQTGKSWEAVGGSRSDGIIKLAYPIGLFNYSAPDDFQGTALAAERCKVWGYQNATAFGGKITQCERRNGFGDCLNGIVIKEYQCTGGR